MKTIVSITLDYELAAEMKARGEKISPIVNSLIASYLSKVKTPEEVEKMNNLEEAKITMAQKIGSLVEIRKQVEKLEKELKDKNKKEDAEYSEVWN